MERGSASRRRKLRHPTIIAPAATKGSRTCTHACRIGPGSSRHPLAFSRRKAHAIFRLKCLQQDIRADIASGRMSDSSPGARKRRKNCNEKRANGRKWRLNGWEQVRAQEQLQRAITLDPDYVHAHWGGFYPDHVRFGHPIWLIGEFTNKALAAGTRAITLDNEDPGADSGGRILGHARQGRSNLALSHLTKSVELSSGFALGHAGLGYALAVGGQPERGLQSVEQDTRPSRRDPFVANYGLCGTRHYSSSQEV